jgi:benzoylformate decarboxylase
LVGEAATILSHLVVAVQKAIASKGLKTQVVERYQRTKALHDTLQSTWIEEAQHHLEEDPVSPYRIAHELNQLWDDETIWVDGTLTMRRILRQTLLLTKPGTYFTNPSSHLGPAASMAYGVALARPGEKVVTMMGDGDFVFGNAPSVLWTCSHYQIPVLYLVFNNACWGTEWPYLVDTTLGLAAKHKDYECIDVDEPRIEFTNIAKGLRVHADTIEHPDEAAKKLRQGLEQVSKGYPSLVEINLAKYTKGNSSYLYRFKRP